MVQFHRHLRPVAQPVAQTQRLLIPVYGLVKKVLGMADRPQFVENQNGGFLIPVFLNNAAGPVIPTFRFLMLKLQLADQPQSPVILDHFLGIRQPLVDFQGFAVPLFGFGIKPLILPRLPQGKIVVSHGGPVLPALDDGKGTLQPVGGYFRLAAGQGDGPELVINRSDPGIRIRIRLGGKIVGQLLIPFLGPRQIADFHRLADIGAQQVEPQVNGPGRRGGFRRRAGRCQQLPPQAAQFREPLLHPIYLRQGLHQQLGIVPLLAFQGQSQGLIQVALLGQHRRSPGILIFVQGFHKIVGGVGIDPHELGFQPADIGRRNLPAQLAAIEPGQGRMYLIDAGRNRFQKAGGQAGTKQGTAGSPA